MRLRVLERLKDSAGGEGGQESMGYFISGSPAYSDKSEQVDGGLRVPHSCFSFDEVDNMVHLAKPRLDVDNKSRLFILTLAIHVLKGSPCGE